MSSDTASAMSNGLNDGWMRPPGRAPAQISGDATDYAKRGVALTCRYWVFWVTNDIKGQEHTLHCNFDDLTAAIEHVADMTEQGYLSGGVWDRRMNKWSM